ncbi:MAG: VOC family protein [Gammaproteobacteria bacterium]|nr:VOC family protein [Gammaproteobacteria bacterium]
MKQVPTDFRRVTMMVNRMEPALSIYRDVLGMEVYFDQEIVVSGKALPAGEAESKTRLVILRCNDPYIGMLGMMQYIDPPLPEPDPRPVPGRLSAGDIVFVMNHENVEAAFEKLKDIEGIEMVAEPHVSEYPGDGGSVLRVMGISFFDPNGYFIELKQIVE